MNRIDVSVTNAEIARAVKQISLFEGSMRIRLENALEAGTKRMASAAKRRAPVGRGGAHSLSGGIRSSFNRARLAGEVRSFAPHSHLLEFGVKASRVKPKNKKAMRVSDWGIVQFIRREVVIPARMARPFMRPAYEEHKDELIRDVRKAVTRE